MRYIEPSPEESVTDKLEDRIRVLEGQMRAHQALFVEIARKAPNLVQAAIERVRDDARRRNDFAKYLEAQNLPLDEQAEAPLHAISSIARYANSDNK
jgi:hypothetical protein